MKKYKRPALGKVKVIYDPYCPPGQMYVFTDDRKAYLYPKDAHMLSDPPGWKKG